jgi:hypothetical protein
MSITPSPSADGPDSGQLALELLLAVPELAPGYLDLVATGDEEPGEALLLELLADLLADLLGSAAPAPHGPRVPAARPALQVARRALDVLEASLAREPDLADLVTWSFLDGLPPGVLASLRPLLGPRLGACAAELAT